MTIIDEINHLKEERNAVILAHYYVRPEIQALADYVGDSFYLSKLATNLDKDTIVFCGVSFMGESAKLLNPNKIVLMPDRSADCAMAHMVDLDYIQKVKDEYDDLAVVCYINSMAEHKAYSDVCVTSSNAVKIVKALPNKNILFIPDRNLGHYVASQVPEKNFIYNEGYCPVHDEILLEQLVDLKETYPEALVLSHPECGQKVLDHSDYIGSTSGIINYVNESDSSEFIICTEKGIEYELKKNNPEKKFYFTESEPICKDMKYITLEKIRDVLKTDMEGIEVSDNVSEKAKVPLERMLELAQ